jgi:alkanesulfonate monooxygenase SsuD/methylene tetrahydromethanopterin reductase-like flavin-dependent oxidoreductase (luciferase family)
MKLGVSLTSAHPGALPADGARTIIDRARAARDADLDSLSLGDHHSTPFPYYQAVPMIGRLIAEWGSDRPIGCLFLLPLWNPVLVAEMVGTLACLTDEPFIVQTGIGSGAGQFAAMGADPSRRGADLDESIRVIQALLAGDTVSSERFGFRDAVVNPRPPHEVDWWIGAGSPGPLDRAARLGQAWYAGPDVTPDTGPALLELYHDACRHHARVPRAVVRKDVIVLRDGARARRLGDDLVAAGYRGLPRAAVVCGGVDEVVEELLPYRQLGFEQVVVRTMAGITQGEALETLELCGAVREHLAR